MIDRIAQVRAAMEEYFGEDRKRIEHALKVTAFAGQLMEEEPANPDLVIATALLHDIGIREAERKYGSSAGNLQEVEGPPVAREILSGIGFSEPFIGEVCEIIASHHSPGEVDTENFRIIWDADWLVNMGDECDLSDPARTEQIIKKTFQTRTGRRIARHLYLKR
ncbi:MAG TPA: HD domain-containing protein [Geobacteraceae bacterium]|nr:HD domain-containing protein [Geobacteraceae bacterium]